ncbi:MAG: hypothetical protein KOO61_02435 [Spirochaetales bacterium]|nr:hypothetical protein [Spirochaetales bacterium]
MIDLLRSLPQGMLWYPLLLCLTFALGRVVWSVGRQFASRKLEPPAESDHLALLALLVQRAQSDRFANQELERCCIGLLLQASGYTGYSAASCRIFLATSPGSPAAAAVEGHLTEIEQGGRAGGSASFSPSHRIEHILEAVERITEAPRG